MSSYLTREVNVMSMIYSVERQIEERKLSSIEIRNTDK